MHITCQNESDTINFGELFETQGLFLIGSIHQPLFGKGARAPPPKAIDAYMYAKISETQLIFESYLYKPKGYVSETPTELSQQS